MKFFDENLVDKTATKIGGLAANILEEYSPNKKICKKFSENIPDAYGYGHYKIYPYFSIKNCINCYNCK